MLDLTVVEVEDDALIVTDNSGTRYRLILDDSTRRQIRRTSRGAAERTKVSPRQIQTHIRAGLSAQEVADTTGAPVEYVERFEGPIIAEREHIVSLALSSPLSASPAADDEPAQFGTTIRARLETLGAHSERWASWRDDEGTWFVKVEFTADEIAHDARWTFDVQRRALEPINAEAVSLSAPEEPSEGLMPRLRAVASPVESDTARFDSGAFAVTDDAPTPVHAEPAKPTRINNNSIRISAITRSPETSDDYQDTAELLEALRRRRGQRAEPPQPQDETEVGAQEHESSAPAHLIDLPLESLGEEDLPAAEAPSDDKGPSTAAPAHAERSTRKGRASIPSWDEIVFGARGDDDA